MPATKVVRQKSAGAGQARRIAKAEAKLGDRPVQHPKYVTKVFHGDEPITEELAKELLGWEEESDKDKFGNKHVTDVSRLYSTKVRCSNNVNNRFIDVGSLTVLKQEILNGRWKFNGEPLIIGRTGLILNGQHCLISLILAVKAWRETPDSYPKCPTEPTIDKLIVYGVAEDDTTVNTMDTCKPRSLSDVIGRSTYFGGLKGKGRKVASKMAEHAIKMLWKRTGVHINALGTKQTHAESIAYLDQHPKLVKAVKHIYEENNDSENKIGKYLSAGYASAALFLMGSSATDSEAYYSADNPSEKLLDWSRWERASEFFVELASGAPSLNPVRQYITTLLNQGAGTWQDRWAVIAKAWDLYRKNRSVTVKSLELKFEVKDDTKHLVEEPLMGGIDVGTEGIHHSSGSDPTVAETETKTEKARDKKYGKAKNGAMAGKVWAAGDTAWVHTKSEEPYFCTLKNEPYACNDGTTKVMVSAADGEWEVDVAELSLKQFEKPTA